MNNAGDIIYLDNNATTPLDPRVLEAMMPFLTNQYGNASSNHRFGVDVNQKVKNARVELSELINCDPNEIVFTSGATEAINLAIKGVAEYYGGDRNHIVTVSTEHPAVLDCCNYLEKKGFNVTYLSVDQNGLIDLEELEKSISDKTILVSTMLVNNETGVIQPVKEISRLAHAKGAIFMTDATQAVGKMDINVNDLGIDLMALSAHKFYGPKGVGALYFRNKRPFRVKLVASIHGGGHERAIRSGTLNVPGIIGLGKAAELAKIEAEDDRIRISELLGFLESELLSLSGSDLNGHLESRLYNVANIRFAGADADAVIAGIDNLAISNGSACSSIKVEPSHVLTAMGLNEQEAYSSIRFSLGRMTTSDEVRRGVELITSQINRLRTM